MKQYIRSPWPFLLYLPLLIIAVFIHYECLGDTGNEMKYAFLEMLYLSIYLIVFAIHQGKNVDQWEVSLITPRKIVFARLCSTFLIAISGVVILACHMAVVVGPHELQGKLAYSFWLYQYISWLLPSCFFILLGFGLGIFLGRNWAYPLGVFVVVMMSPLVQQSSFSRESMVMLHVKNLLNLIYDDPTRTRFYSFGFSLDQAFCWGALFYVALCLGLFCFDYLIFHHKIEKKKVWFHRVSVGGLFIGGLFCVICLKNYFTFIPAQINCIYSGIEGVEQLNNKTVDPDLKGIWITEYNMDLQIDKELQNDCTFTIHNQSNTTFDQNLPLRLERCLQIYQLKVNDQTQSFEREGDFCVFPIKLNAGESVTISLQYGGNIYFVDGLNNPSVFVSNQGALLPELFAWYPKLQTEKREQWYSLSIQAPNPVISNLTNGTAQQNCENLVIEGSAPDVYLISGYFTTLTINKWNVTFPTFYANIDSVVSRLPEKIQTLCAAIEEGGVTWNLNYDTPLLKEDENALEAIVFAPITYNANVLYGFDNTFFVTEDILTYE